MTNIVIQPLTAANLTDLNRCDNSFTVEAELRLTAEDGRIGYSVEPVTPYVKRYGPEIFDAQAYLEKPDHAAWLAYVDGRIAGQILVHEHWNRFAIIWDIAVDPLLRRRGVGRRLTPAPTCSVRRCGVAQAIAWARDRGLPGVMLETQSVNVAACRLYERCGFVLGGFDACLYRGVMPGTHEIALFWYLLFSASLEATP
jgi:GNAT superfamily N-acetyltransferase